MDSIQQFQLYNMLISHLTPQDNKIAKVQQILTSTESHTSTLTEVTTSTATLKRDGKDSNETLRNVSDIELKTESIDKEEIMSDAPIAHKNRNRFKDKYQKNNKNIKNTKKCNNDIIDHDLKLNKNTVNTEQPDVDLHMFNFNLIDKNEIKEECTDTSAEEIITSLVQGNISQPGKNFGKRRENINNRNLKKNFNNKSTKANFHRNKDTNNDLKYDGNTNNYDNKVKIIKKDKTNVMKYQVILI